MTIKIYVNWEEQEIYRNENELIEGYKEHECPEDDFRDFLDNNYTSDEIFSFSEYQRMEVEELYNIYLLNSAHDWVYRNNMEQDIEI